MKSYKQKKETAEGKWCIIGAEDKSSEHVTTLAAAIQVLEEQIESLSDEQQEAILASIDQKEQELQNSQVTEKSPTKHL